LWLPLPFSVGAAAADALADASRPVQVVASGGMWLAWSTVLACMVVPRTATLTVVRIAAPIPLCVALAALADDGSVTATDALACAHAAIVVLVALVPSVGATFVDGSSYGDEQRLPLRPPAALMLGPIELAWLAVAVPLVLGPLLLAARAWVAGAVVVAVGAAAARRAIPSLHALSRRWLVLVPAGVVVHDPLSLAEPVLLRRSSIRRFAPAEIHSTALDLTGGALGLALEITLAAPVDVPLVKRRATEVQAADRLLVTPSRPGAVLVAASGRGVAT
jgi:hypothetical protein